MKAGSIEACVFDAYGTLFDVHSAVGKLRPRLGEKADRVSGLWRAKQLEYSWLRSLMGEYVDFWTVTGDALAYAFESHGIDDPDLTEALMQAYLSLDCYPEVPGALERLKAGGMRTAVLSNGSPRMLDAAVRNAGLGGLLDAVWSVDGLRIYKPHPSVYRVAVDELGIDASRVCFVSSNAFDVSGAAVFGFQVAWINRFEQTQERLPGKARIVIRTLDALAEQLLER